MGNQGKNLFLLLFLICCLSVKYSLSQTPDFLKEKSEWVDSVFNSMTLDEKIGQLFMVAAYSNRDEKHHKEIEYLIRNFKIGGLIFFQGGPLRQAKLTNRYQSLSEIPLMIGIDAEWGLGMRLDSTISYPRQMILGALQNNELIYKMGQQIAEQTERLGVHINFAPVADINSNDKNPVINTRSFGSSRIDVAQKAYAYMAGMQSENVLAVGKHFPGHGDTESDSHHTLPIVRHERKRLDSIELFPFKYLINNKLGGVMIAHLSVPALDSSMNLPTTLSSKVVNDLLKKELGFEGLIFTDAMNMQGVASIVAEGEAEAKAILAGNDVILFPKSVSKAIKRIKKALKSGELSEEAIDQSCKKILLAKKWFGLNEYKPIEFTNLYSDLNKDEYQNLNQKIAEKSICLLRDRKSAIPFINIHEKDFFSIEFNKRSKTKISDFASTYTELKNLEIAKELSAEKIIATCENSRNPHLIISYHSTDIRPSKNFDIKADELELISKIAKEIPVSLLYFGNPYGLRHFAEIEEIDVIIAGFENSENFWKSSVEAVFGGIELKGKMPVIINYEIEDYRFNNTRLAYCNPENAGLDGRTLEKIDSIVQIAIDTGATPGCQVLVARKGRIAYHKSFGFHTYDKKHVLKNNHLFDLASITKIAATMPALMKLFEDGKFSTKSTISDYFSHQEESNKDTIQIHKVLIHSAQLYPWIPFFVEALEKDSSEEKVFSNIKSSDYPVQIAENLFISTNYKDTIFKRIFESDLWEKEEYKYSDLGFYIFKELIENITNQEFSSFCDSEFYRVLGAKTLCFNPLKNFQKDQIVPTEYDTIFRNQLIQGYVHDPGAAMLGGVCGHAGLFGNSLDLAKLMQMFLWKGSYGGHKFFEKETVDYFTQTTFPELENRRALGFDKAELDTSKIGPTCHSATALSFGHTGFTGTMAWADPEYDLIYIFLSNRIYPDASNKKLIELDIRTQIQQVIYDAVR